MSTHLLSIDGQVAAGKTAKAHFTDPAELLERVTHSMYRDLRGQLNRIAIYTGADAWKRHRCHAVFMSQFENPSVARGEELGFVLPAAMPYRPHGVNDAPGTKTITKCIWR